ncbi:thiamine-synthetic flavin transferase lipoprotein [Bacteroidales bacterium]|nr:thiamine-synthetic flavin transferase lipoprotein [Bacteroidales bacterium]
MKYKGILFLLSTYLLSSCSQEEKKEYHHFRGEVFHTSFSIKYEHSESLDKEMRARLDSFDLSLNPFNKESIIYKVNNNTDVDLDIWFTTVFERSMEVSEHTSGAFDITCAPLINLWGFGFSKMGDVSPRKIDSLMQFVGYNKIRLQAGRLIKEDDRIQLNTSAIAKGYSCDLIAELLQGRGVENYMVEIGGEINARGLNPRGECWKIEITKPNYEPTGLLSERQGVVSLCNKSMATSGNYRNFYVKDGKRYAHTIDPRTAYPAEKDILGASIFADNCMTADAYATAFMTLGLDSACRIADKIDGMMYYFVYSDSEGNPQVKFSDNMQEFIQNSEY